MESVFEVFRVPMSMTTSTGTNCATSGSDLARDLRTGYLDSGKLQPLRGSEHQGETPPGAIHCGGHLPGREKGDRDHVPCKQSWLKSLSITPRGTEKKHVKLTCLSQCGN